MKVLLAKNAGFCMGVRRAVETTLDVIHKEGNGVSTFGPLIHNPQVLDLLENRGVQILTEIPAQKTGTVVIRAHGVPPAKKEQLENAGAKVKDATCPHVVKVQVIIERFKKQGYATVIIGDKNHAEVEGLMGYAAPFGQVVSSAEDIETIKLSSPYIIVSQTTQDDEVFEALSRKILERFPEGKVFNTICDSTHKRQNEVRELCEKVEAMVVVGGRNSANTQRLGEIVSGLDCPVFMIESEEDIDQAALAKYNRVGVTAGASTPTWLINSVVRTLEAIPGHGEGLLKIFIKKAFWLTLVTNFYVSLAGGLLAYTCVLLQKFDPRAEYFLIAFTYIFGMHNLNRFTDQKAKKFNDPVSVLFYQRFRWPLFTLSSLALAVSLTLAFGLGLRSFALLVGMTILGVVYSVRFIPKALTPIVRIRGLKEIPGSKTILVAAAWSFLTTLIPAWSFEHVEPDMMTVGVLEFSFLLVLVRNALFDVFEVQGDRIVGKETLPVFIGKEKTLVILQLIIGLLVILLIVFPVLGWMSPLAFWMVPGIFYLAVLMYCYQKEIISQGPKLEFMLESVFFLLAGLAWLGSHY